MPTINLTQHPAMEDQIKAGVVDLKGKTRQHAISALTFGDLPSQEEVASTAALLAMIARGAADAHGADRVMIGGAPFLMAALHAAIHAQGLTPVYAFSKRESEEQTQPDGSVRKVAVFRHLGFVGGEETPTCQCGSGETRDHCSQNDQFCG